jgi:hypothetical protein
VIRTVHGSRFTVHDTFGGCQKGSGISCISPELRGCIVFMQILQGSWSTIMPWAKTFTWQQLQTQNGLQQSASLCSCECEFRGQRLTLPLLRWQYSSISTQGRVVRITIYNANMILAAVTCKHYRYCKDKQFVNLITNVLFHYHLP